MIQAAAEVLGELEDEKEANAAAHRRSKAAAAQAAKLQIDLHALQQEAEQARQHAAAAMQEADARVSCRGQPGSLAHKGEVSEQSGELRCPSHGASQ